MLRVFFTRNEERHEDTRLLSSVSIRASQTANSKRSSRRKDPGLPYRAHVSSTYTRDICEEVSRHADTERKKEMETETTSDQKEDQGLFLPGFQRCTTEDARRQLRARGPANSRGKSLPVYSSQHPPCLSLSSEGRKGRQRKRARKNERKKQKQKHFASNYTARGDLRVC